MSIILAAPHVNQLMVPFIEIRSIYELRERPSLMYSWSALVTSQLLVEAPCNLLGSGLYYLCWYWTVGFANSRAGYTYLKIAVIFPLYYTTIGQAVAAMSPNAVTANILFGTVQSFTFVL